MLRVCPRGSDEFDNLLRPRLWGTDETRAKGVQHGDLAFVNQARRQVRKLCLATN